MNNNQIEQYFEHIAAQEGISAEEVRKNIGLAISYALKSNNPKIQNFWKDIPCKGDNPTVEEIINYIAMHLSEHSK